MSGYGSAIGTPGPRKRVTGHGRTADVPNPQGKGVSHREDAFEMVQTNEPGTVALLCGLAGRLTGLEAALRFNGLAPQSKIIFFAVHVDLREAVAAEAAIDAFVLKTDSKFLLRVAQQLLARPGQPTDARV
jgi:hypothetical protein